MDCGHPDVLAAVARDSAYMRVFEIGYANQAQNLRLLPNVDNVPKLLFWGPTRRSRVCPLTEYQDHGIFRRSKNGP